MDPTLDLIVASDDDWRLADGESVATAALGAVIGPHRGPSVASKVLHLKRPRLFPVLDELVAVMLGINMPEDATQSRRVKIAVDLPVHLRAQGRANLEQLETIQTTLKAQGVDRSLVRILDGIVRFSHPAAGVPNVAREITVTADARSL